MTSANLPAASEMQQRERSAAMREAIVLPAIFLTVALGGGFRMAASAPGSSGPLVFLVPSLMALVLSLLLVGVLFRSGALVPDALMHATRPALGNISGVLVLASLFAAGAQVFNTITPEAGLLQFIFNVFFLLLLWNTMAARPDRRRLLHSLVVVFGGAFLLKYVVLGALYDPQGGATKRVLMALLEGVTLGGLTYQSPAPVTGYVAFFTVLLFLAGLILLPQDLLRTRAARRESIGEPEEAASRATLPQQPPLEVIEATPISGTLAAPRHAPSAPDPADR
jgi:hypothetical protein